MKELKTFTLFLLGYCLSAVLCHAQTRPAQSFTPNEVNFFLGLFEKLGDLHPEATVAQRQEAALASLLRLDARESAVLRSVSLDFNRTMRTVRESQRTIVSTNRMLTDADRAQLAQLARERDRAVGVLAATLLSSVRQETAAYLRSLAQEASDLLTKKGVQ